MKVYEEPAMEILTIIVEDDIVTLSVGVGDGESVEGNW